jgi:hypothetical protein
MSSVLPEGWIHTSVGRARRSVDELQRELSPDLIDADRKVVKAGARVASARHPVDVS